MATPVKAYTSPTTGALKWLTQGVSVPQSIQVISTYKTAAQKISTTTASSVHIPARGLVKAPYSPDPTQFNIPTPPMGTIKLATFPAIYFRKASSRPPTGQLWPRTR